MADDAIIPLHVIDVLDGSFDIDFLFEETKLPRESDFSEHLQDHVSWKHRGEETSDPYIKREIMQQIPQIANPLVVGGVLLQVLHQKFDHVLDRFRPLLHLW